MKKINFYLWKLKFLEGIKIRKRDVDKKNLPDNINISKWTGEYTKVECKDINVEELNTFIKVKNAYNINLIRICVVICTILFVLVSMQYIDSM